MAVKNLEQPPKRLKDMLNQLSTIARWVQEFGRSAARLGANLALARAKAYLPALDVGAVDGEFPEYKIDSSEFSHEDYVNCMMKTCQVSTVIVDKLDLARYQPA